MSEVLVLLIIFGSITVWKWMSLQTEGGSKQRVKQLEGRVAALEAELGELRTLVHDAVIEVSDRERLGASDTGRRSLDA
ncbi:MAG: hypothetical protein IT204_09215 [Fimbriimonadaceae bacterium]|nr:hypothetical protein [Fimbriimonadaceae bacterium]